MLFGCASPPSDHPVSETPAASSAEPQGIVSGDAPLASEAQSFSTYAEATEYVRSHFNGESIDTSRSSWITGAEYFEASVAPLRRTAKPMLRTNELAPDHFSSACERGPTCPVTAVHRRLQEAHRQWHQAADHYSDPEAFASYVNAAVQALRNVTFILQSQKSEIPDFGPWYAEWQERYGLDPIMKWVRDARNKVVKQDDLQTYSTARFKVLTWWDEPPVFEAELDPMIPTRALAGHIASRPEFSEDVRKVGVVVVERRWVERDLPGHEVLTALAHCYAVLAATINHLHQPASARGAASAEPVAHVPCMVSTEFDRTISISLATGQELIFGEGPSAPEDDLPSALIEKRYKLSNIGDPCGPTSSLRERALYAFQMAKRLIEKDGYHEPIVLYFTADGKSAVTGFDMGDRAELLVTWRVVAANVRKMRAVAIISITEAWIAPVPEDGVVRIPAAEDPDRREILSVHAAARDGEEFSLDAEITRNGRKARVGPIMETTSLHSFYLQPVRAVWKDTAALKGEPPAAAPGGERKS